MPQTFSYEGDELSWEEQIKKMIIYIQSRKDLSEEEKEKLIKELKEKIGS